MPRPEVNDPEEIPSLEIVAENRDGKKQKSY
jgi:hypothetical protein